TRAGSQGDRGARVRWRLWPPSRNDARSQRAGGAVRLGTLAIDMAGGEPAATKRPEQHAHLPGDKNLTQPDYPSAKQYILSLRKGENESDTRTTATLKNHAAKRPLLASPEPRPWAVTECPRHDAQGPRQDLSGPARHRIGLDQALGTAWRPEWAC